MMKRLIIVTFLILSGVLLFAADNSAPLELKSTASSGTKSFIVKFSGAQYAEIGFSKTAASVSSGQGLIKSDIENNSLTLEKIGGEQADQNGIYYYSYKSSSSCYIYWYLSLKTEAELELSVVASKGKEYNITKTDESGNSTVEKTIPANSVKVALDTYKYTNDPKTPTVTENQEVTSGSTINVATFSKSYAVYQGNSKFSITNATVYQYPENRNIGVLTLTLRTIE